MASIRMIGVQIGLLLLMFTLIVSIKAAPAKPEEREWRLVGQTDDDEDESGDVMELSEDVIIGALFSNLDTLQDELEICEEGLRLKLLGLDDETLEMQDNDFVDDPDNLLSQIAELETAGYVTVKDKEIQSNAATNMPVTLFTNSLVTNDRGKIMFESNNQSFRNASSGDQIGNETNDTRDRFNNHNSTTTVSQSVIDSNVEKETRNLDFHGDVVQQIDWDGFQSATSSAVTQTDAFETTKPATNENLTQEMTSAERNVFSGITNYATEKTQSAFSNSKNNTEKAQSAFSDIPNHIPVEPQSDFSNTTKHASEESTSIRSSATTMEFSIDIDELLQGHQSTNETTRLTKSDNLTQDTLLTAQRTLSTTNNSDSERSTPMLFSSSTPKEIPVDEEQLQQDHQSTLSTTNNSDSERSTPMLFSSSTPKEIPVDEEQLQQDHQSTLSTTNNNDSERSTPMLFSSSTPKEIPVDEEQLQQDHQSTLSTTNNSDSERSTPMLFSSSTPKEIPVDEEQLQQDHQSTLSTTNNNDSERSTPMLFSSSTPKQVPAGEEQLHKDHQSSRERRSIRSQSPRALVVTKLSKRLQRLKRWVIDCHVMYKMLK